MTDTKEILEKLARLRKRLEQTQAALVPTVPVAETGGQEVMAGTSALPRKDGPHAGSTESWHNALLNTALHGLEADRVEAASLRLTARARRLLQEGRRLLGEMRTLGEDPQVGGEDAPLGEPYRAAAALLEVTLRTVQAFPTSPSMQMRLCEGLEEALRTVEERVRILAAGAEHLEARRCDLEELAGLLLDLQAGGEVSVRNLHALGRKLWDRARTNAPLRFFVGRGTAASLAAAHGLNVGQVLARLLLSGDDWKGQEAEAIAAALVLDIGMLQVPDQILFQEAPLTEEQRRLVERHPLLGAHLLEKVWPGGGWPVEAARDHHERPDGTGYPGGKRELQLSAFARLVAVCDVYAACRSPRPQRPALDPRAALTETLLMADQGALDRFQAEKLLALGFYPNGTVVELDDGALGLVVGTHPGQQGLLNPARPILLLLAQGQGRCCAGPRLVDLLQEEGRTIVRAVAAERRSTLFAGKYPALI